MAKGNKLWKVIEILNGSAATWGKVWLTTVHT